jgi:uncharacterized protein (DUF433 family)
MDGNGEYKFLNHKQGSRYQQLFVNGRILAEVLYRETVGGDPLSPEEVAREYNLPVEAVQEAIHYCEHHPEILDADRARETDFVRQDGRDRWPYAPQDHRPQS